MMRRYPVWWHAPFLGGTGYGSEALQFVFSLVRSGAMRRRDVWVALHGDGVKKDVAAGMAPEDRRWELRQGGARGAGADEGPT